MTFGSCGPSCSHQPQAKYVQLSSPSCGASVKHSVIQVRKVTIASNICKILLSYVYTHVCMCACVCVCVHVLTSSHAHKHLCRGQRTTCCRQFSPATVLVPELNGSLGLTASGLSRYAILQFCSVFGSISFLILKIRTIGRTTILTKQPPPTPRPPRD